MTTNDMEMDKKESVLEYVATYAQTKPDKACIMEKDLTVTYGAFWDMIQAFARRLRAEGLCPGECVVVVAEQSASFLAAGFAIQLAGGVFVPLEKGIGIERLKEVIKLTEARALISRNGYEADCPYIPMEAVEERAAEPMEEFVFPKGDETSDILFTTGTTGTPKGIEMSYSGTLAVAENFLYGLGIKPNNVELVPIPVNHAHGLRRCYANFINGSAVVLMDGIVFVNQVFDTMEKYKVTALCLVPAALSVLLQLGKERLSSFLDQIDYISLGTSALSEAGKQALCALFPRSRLFNCYGITEAGGSCIVNFNISGSVASCIGTPTVNSSITFVDDNKREIIATQSKPGLLAVSGKMLMKGYYKDLQATASVMQNGYMYSSDMAYMGNNGNIYLIGRKDDVINIGGNKVSPSEIEDAAMALDDIEDCACIPIEDNIAGQVPKLFVEMKPGRDFSVQAISEFLSHRLDPFKMPKIIAAIDKIPRTYNGKKQRNLLH